MSVAVPGAEFHALEEGPLAKDLIDETQALHEFGPVEPGDEAHAGDHVPDRHVHGRLALVLKTDDLLGARALRRHDLLEPSESRRDRRILVAQALEQLDLTGRRQRLASEPAERGRGDLGLVLAEAEQTIGEVVGPLSRFAAADDRFRKTAQVLHEHDAQADGDGPEFPDGQRLYSLVGAHETEQAIGVETAVSVSHVRPRHADDPGIPLQMAFGKLG